jgi:hypothetical protein
MQRTQDICNPAMNALCNIQAWGIRFSTKLSGVIMWNKTHRDCVNIQELNKSETISDKHAGIMKWPIANTCVVFDRQMYFT